MSSCCTCAGELVESLSLVSGTAGISDAAQRLARCEKDDALAAVLEEKGAMAFIQDWYQQPMWRTLRQHPRSERDCSFVRQVHLTVS